MCLKYGKTPRLALKKLVGIKKIGTNSGFYRKSKKSEVLINQAKVSINVLLNDGLSGVVNASGMVIADLLGILPPLSTPVSIVEGYFNYDCVLDYGIWNEMTESFVILVNQSGPSTEDFVFCSVFENGK